MATYQSGTSVIRIDHQEPGREQTQERAQDKAQSRPHAALVVLHGSGGASRYWLERFAPAMGRFGIAAYAPHYFDKTGTDRATAEMILDGKHFAQWLAAVKDAITYVAQRPMVDARRIGVLGISLGGYLAIALAAEDTRVRAAIELSGGMPPGWEDRLSRATPPVLVLHGEQDTVVPVSEAHKLAALLQAHRVEHQVELFAGETHWFSARAQPRLLMACATFLGRYLL